MNDFIVYRMVEGRLRSEKVPWNWTDRLEAAEALEREAPRHPIRLSAYSEDVEVGVTLYQLEQPEEYVIELLGSIGAQFLILFADRGDAVQYFIEKGVPFAHAAFAASAAPKAPSEE